MKSNSLPAMKKSLFSLILVVIVVLGPCTTTAKAFSLEEPQTTYEDFLAYDGIKVFINGRYVDFNEETGYPFIENGTIMISLNAITVVWEGTQSGVTQQLLMLQNMTMEYN